MRGFYRIYKGDTLVCEQNNSLTIVGRSLIIKSLLGLIPSVGGSIVIGVDGQSNPALNSDKLIDLNNMGFSIGQSPVQVSTLDRTDNVDALVFKTTINDPSLASAPIPGIDAVLRVRYRPQPYSISEPSCTYEYKPSFFDTTLYSSDSLQLQFAFNIDPTDSHISPLLTMNTGETNSLDSKILRNPINFN